MERVMVWSEREREREMPTAEEEEEGGSRLRGREAEMRKRGSQSAKRRWFAGDTQSKTESCEIAQKLGVR